MAVGLLFEPEKNVKETKHKNLVPAASICFLYVLSRTTFTVANYLHISFVCLCNVRDISYVCCLSFECWSDDIFGVKPFNMTCAWMCNFALCDGSAKQVNHNMFLYFFSLVMMTIIVYHYCSVCLKPEGNSDCRRLE